MSYVFDNAPLSMLFKNYYPKTFKTLWEKFDKLIEEKEIISTREVFREIEDASDERFREWAKQNIDIFSVPNSEEATFVSTIYSVKIL